MKVNEETRKMIKNFIKHRKEKTNWDNCDTEMIIESLVELGIMAYTSNCWGYASVCICDDGEISLHG